MTTTVLEQVFTSLARSDVRRVERRASIAELTTYRLGGPVAVLARVGSDVELAALVRVVRDLGPPLLVVGRGSNLLVADTGFVGLGVVLDGDFERIAMADDHVMAGGAVALPVLARRTAAAGRAGLEFFVGIPGTVGGAVRMNAGGHGRETRDVLRAAWICDLAGAGRRELRTVDQLDLGYRHSALGPSEVVTGAELAVVPERVERSEERIAEIVRWRRDHQPGGANAGSVFRNPPDDSAGRIIDACGLAGRRVGGAVVSSKHANFIQAEGGATASDVRSLVLDVQREVEERTGRRLVPELRMVGFEEPAARGEGKVP